MAKFIIEFEDSADGGGDARIELIDFDGAEDKPLQDRTVTQNLYFSIEAYLKNNIGLKIPEAKTGKIKSKCRRVNPSRA